MTPFAAEKARNREWAAEDRRERRTAFRSNPTQLVIEPTNRCDGVCPICARHFWDGAKNPPVDLAPDTLALLEPFLRTADTVFAFGHGEPTIAPIFWDVVAAAKDHGCRVEVTTNGLGLDEAAIDRFIAARVDILNVSLDALDPAASLARRGLDPAKVARLFAYLSQARYARGAAVPEAGLAVAVDRDNLDELPHLFRFALAAGVKTMLVNHAIAWDESRHERSAYHEPERLARVLADLRAAAVGTPIHLVLPYDNLLEGGACPHPFQMFFVRAGGDVWPCCNAVFHNDRYSFPVGNLRDQPLRDLWNAAPYRALRRAFFTGAHLPTHCRICPLRVDSLASHQRTLR